uniref:Uncharacterized protein n=1 Tax=Romanomermis culicivorax TaxID=13658 RepID=A0A915IE04_ROMCU
MASKLGPIDQSRPEKPPAVPNALPSSDTTGANGQASDLPGPYLTANTSAV